MVVKPIKEKILEGAGAIYLSNAVSALAGFVSTVVIVRCLGKFSYGQFVILMSVYSFCISILDLNSSSLFVSEIAQAKGKNDLGQVKFLILTYLKIIIIGSLFFLLVLSAAYLFTRFLSGPHIPRHIFIIGIYLFLSGILNFFDTCFYGYGKFRYKFILESSNAIIRLLFIVILVMVLKKGFVGVLISYCLAFLFVILFIFPFWARLFRPLKNVRTAKDAALIQNMKSQGIFLFLSLPSKRAIDLLPVWVTKFLFGFEAVAILGVAQKAFNLLYSFFSALENAVFPIISEQRHIDWPAAKVKLSKVTRYALLLAALAAAMAWFLAPVVFPFVFSKAYLEAVPLFRLYLIVLLVYVLSLTQRPMFYALRGQRELFFVNLLTLLLFLPLIWCFANWLGLQGVVCSVIIISGVTYYTRNLYLARIETE